MSKQKITVGENLKRIRKDLNLRQYEISGNDVTRNLISLMENDKTPIYHNVANIISKNINKIISKRGLDIYIQPEDILDPERYTAREKANIYIETLKNRLDKEDYEIEFEELNEMENFLNKWNFIDKKVKIYDLLGDIYYNARDPHREYYYYLKALEVSYEYPNMKDRYKIILKLVYNCIINKKFEEAARLCSFALSTQDNMMDKYKGIFYYNNALANFHIGDYSKCLDQLIYSKFYVAYDNYREMKKILILEGTCNSAICNYDGAVRNYNKLLKIIDKNETEEICLAYINILQIYIDKNDNKKIIEYRDKVMEYLPSIDKTSYYLPQILFSVSHMYYYLDDYESCEKNLQEALSLSKHHEDKTLFSNIFLELLNLYIKTNKPHKIESLVITYEKQLLNFETNKNFEIILKIIHNFIEQNNNWEAKYLINNLLKNED